MSESKVAAEPTASASDAAADDSSTEDASEAKINRYSPEAVLLQLQAKENIDDASRTALLDGLTAQLLVVRHLQERTVGETMNDMDVCLLTFLKGCFCQLSSLPGTVRYDMLTTAIASSGMVMPFIAGIGSANELIIGAPSKTDVLCDTLSEIVRAAAAAVCCYVHYLTYSQTAHSFPTDDACLLFATLTIRSLAAPDMAATLETSAADAGFDLAQQRFGMAELKWLMHHVRGELLGYFGQVQYLLGNEEKVRECYVAQQHEQLMGIKVLPTRSAAAYAAYAQSCLQLQQAKAALTFATKGLEVAQALGARFYIARLHLLRAAALALGGGGAAFDLCEVTRAQAAAKGCVEELLEWLPVPYHDLVRFGPEAAVCEQVQEQEEEEGAADAQPAEDDEDVSAQLDRLARQAQAERTADGGAAAAAAKSNGPSASSLSGPCTSEGQQDEEGGGGGEWEGVARKKMAVEMRPALTVLVTIRPPESLPPGAIVPIEDEAAANATAAAAANPTAAATAPKRSAKGPARSAGKR